MNLLIITDNYKQASYVQKALQMENLRSRILLFSNVMNLEVELIGMEAVLTLMNSKPHLAKFLEFFAYYKIPIVALANEDDSFYSDLIDQDKISFYFVRPFPFKNLAKRVCYLIFENKNSKKQKRYIHRDLELNTEKRQLVFKGNSIYLGNKEFSLMQFFMENPGKVLTRNEILEAVWDRNANMFTNTVDVHISKLRSKFSDHGAKKTIKTIPCVGYLLE